MRFLDDLQNSRQGIDCVLVCGGTTSVKELNRIPYTVLEQADFAGVNQHAIINPFLSWVYAHDEPMIEFLKSQNIQCPIISFKRDLLRENDIHCGENPYVKLSGAEACYTAQYLGYKKIYVLGVDTYADPKRSYWHQYIEDPTRHRENEGTIKPWRLCFEKMEHLERLVFFTQKMIDLQNLYLNIKAQNENTNH